MSVINDAKMKRIYEKFGDLVGLPRICPGCRSLDGEHDFGPSCTLGDIPDEEVAEPVALGTYEQGKFSP